MQKGLRVENNQVVLCGDKICCARIEKLPDGRYKVTDDNGSSVIVTAQEIALMQQGKQQCDMLTEEQLICG